MGFDLITALVREPAYNLWVGRTGDEIFEMLEVHALRDDVDNAFFTGDVLAGMRALSELREPRVPHMVGPPVRVDGVPWVFFKHAPCVMIDVVRAAALKSGGIAAPLVVAFMKDIAGALASMHIAGFHHHAVSPWSLGVDVSGRARIMTAFVERLPAPPLTLGTRTQITYISPEEVAGRELGSPSDVYGLGLVAYELAGGKRAFLSDDVRTMLERIVAGRLPMVRDVRRDLPDELATWIERMLDVDPRARPTAADVVDGLAADLPWATWTRAQVAAELRALLPRETESAQ